LVWVFIPLARFVPLVGFRSLVTGVPEWKVQVHCIQESFH